MKDMIDEVAQKLLSNKRIKELVADRLSIYQYPEQNDHDHTFVVIIPIAPPTPAVDGSNKPLTVEFNYQINVEGKNRKDVKEVQHLIRDEMAAFSFAQISGGLDEFFQETGRYVDARRYRGNSKLYDTNY